MARTVVVRYAETLVHDPLNEILDNMSRSSVHVSDARIDKDDVDPDKQRNFALYIQNKSL